ADDQRRGRRTRGETWPELLDQAVTRRWRRDAEQEQRRRGRMNALADRVGDVAAERLGAHVDAVRAKRRMSDVEQIAIARAAHGAVGRGNEQRAFDGEMPE